jgi:hypothetical protein
MTKGTQIAAGHADGVIDQLIEEGRLKHLLMRLKENVDGAIQPFLTDKLLGRMLAVIGSTDGELRDQLIYSSLVRWVDHGLLSLGQMEQLLAISLDDQHLFYRIGEEGSDAVFTRTFSALAACLVVDKDRERPVLPPELIRSAIARAPEYLCREQDIRGFVPDKGWARGIAHGADLAATVIGHPHCPAAMQTNYLLALEACLLDKTGVYTDDEEERLLGIIDALLAQGMEDEALEVWVQRIAGLLDTKAENDHTLAYHQALTRTRHFMQGLYFRLIFLARGATVRQTIEGILRSWHTSA